MQTFKKNERLGNYRLQTMLFKKGSSFFHYPFRIHYLCFHNNKKLALQPPDKPKTPGASFQNPAKCLISVSKRQIRKAVHRNRIKRLVRETYRKNKNRLYSFLIKEDMIVILAFIYTGKKIMSYADIDAAMQPALKKLMDNLAVHAAG